MCFPKRMSLWFNDFVFDKEDIIFASGDFNGLFRGNLKSGESSLIGVFPNEDIYGCHLYSSVNKYKDYIVFIPGWAKNFVVYDIKHNTFRTILSKMNLVDALNSEYNFAYFANILVEKYLYVFGYDQPKVVRIDMESLEAVTYKGWQEELCQLGKRDKSPYFYKDICIVEDSLFLVTGQNNSIVELNMKTNQIYIHPVGMSGSYFNTIAYDGENFWLTEQTSGVLRVNKSDWTWQYIKMKEAIHTDSFICSIFIDEKIWLFSNWAENIFRICCSNNLLDILEMRFGKSDEWHVYNEKYGYRFTKKISENKFGVFGAQDCRLHLFVNGEDVQQVKYYTEDRKIIEKIYEKRITDIWGNGSFVKEQERKCFQIEDLIYIAGKRKIVKGKGNRDNGGLIYAFIKE